MKRKTIQDHSRSRQSNDILHSNQSENKSENTVVLIEDQSSNSRYNNGDVFGTFQLGYSFINLFAVINTD
jgi:hypothetical protein